MPPLCVSSVQSVLSAGTAKRNCIKDDQSPTGGLWRRPDLSSCVSPVLLQLSRDVSGILLVIISKHLEFTIEFLDFWSPKSAQRILLLVLSLCIFFFSFTSVLSYWDFTHGKFGLLFPGKASCDRVTLPDQRCMLGVLMFP